MVGTEETIVTNLFVSSRIGEDRSEGIVEYVV